jgi:hypothetical protein
MNPCDWSTRKPIVICALLTFALTAIPPPAFAATSAADTWDLYSGSRIVARGLATQDACVNGARDLGPGKYTCRTQTGLVVTVSAGASPSCSSAQPDDDVRSGQCPAGTSGAWTQTRTYARAPYPTCWAAGSWVPEAAPADGCRPAVLNPPPAASDSRKGLVLWEDFTDLRKANNGEDQYWDVYNGNVGDAGPNQKVRGVAGNAMVIDVPAGNILYVDADSPTYTNPRDWLKAHVKSGAVTDATNRLSFLVQSSIDARRRADGGPVFDVGTYIKSTSNLSAGNEGSASSEGHFYHSFGPSFYKGHWVKFVMTNKPSHRRGGPNGANYATVPGYFARETRTYFTPYGYYPGNPASTWQLAQFELYTEEGEADEDVFNLTLTYTGKRYEVGWATSKRKSEKFNVLYSVDGTPFKSFSGGKSGGTVTNSGDDYSQVMWASRAMPESPTGLWIAIRKQGSTLFTSEYLNYQIGPGNTAVPN